MRWLSVPLLLLVWAISARADWHVGEFGGRRYVPISDVVDFYKLKSGVAAGAGEFRLTSPSLTIRGKAGEREVFINNVKYVLCFPILARDGATYLSAMDVTKIIEPVLRPGKIRDAAAVRTVLLDPGHGGHDSGATSPFAIEKDAALDVALRARTLLQAAGYNVRMTRTNDTFVPLEKRAALADRYPNAIFVSIHFNKSKSPEATGIETFALAPRGVPSMDESEVSVRDLNGQPGNAHDPENIALATAMHASMLCQLRVFDRGIKRARFLVIRQVQVPGVLVEGGFISNPNDGHLIADAGYRQRMASAIRDGVAAYGHAVSGQPYAPPPTLIVGAEDRSAPAPVLPAPTPVAPVGSKTDLAPSVARLGLGGQESSAPSSKSE